MEISKTLINYDKTLDYVPVVSTATNLVNIFLKCIAEIVGYQTAITNNHYFYHLKEKDFFDCIILLIPVIGNIIHFTMSSSQIENPQPPTNDNKETSKQSIEIEEDNDDIESVTSEAPTEIDDDDTESVTPETPIEIDNDDTESVTPETPKPVPPAFIDEEMANLFL